ncbi:MAG TPA: hypothetical protein VKG90_02915 [Marmoricola sp.]|jgi:hypothetical protein|nr:hypothetical protein [Marmoricola sp.]
MIENGNDDASTPDDAAEGEGISDEQLPEDLRPTDDNPLAKAPDEGDEDEGLSLQDGG